MTLSTTAEYLRQTFLLSLVSGVDVAAGAAAIGGSAATTGALFVAGSELVSTTAVDAFSGVAGVAATGGDGGTTIVGAAGVVEVTFDGVSSDLTVVDPPPLFLAASRRALSLAAVSARARAALRSASD